MGSAHCDYYHSSEESITDVSHKREHIQRAQPFNGVKKILMEDIEIEDNKFAPPSQEKVQAAIDYYNKNESFDSPVVVSCEGGKYYLQDKYVRYYAALQLGVKEIHARIGTYNDHLQIQILHSNSKKEKRSLSIGMILPLADPYIVLDLRLTHKKSALVLKSTSMMTKRHSTDSKNRAMKLSSTSVQNWNGLMHQKPAEFLQLQPEISKVALTHGQHYLIGI